MNFDHQNPKSQIAVVNFDRLEALRQLDPAGGVEFLKRLISIFLTSAPKFVMQIETAIQTDDRVGLAQSAHSLRSSAANVGAEKLSDICRLLEESENHLPRRDIVELLSKLQLEFRLLVIALQDLQQNYCDSN